MAVGAGVDHDRRGTKGAFGGVFAGLELDLCRAVGAGGNAGLFHLGGGQRGLQSGAEILLGDRMGMPTRAFDWLDIAAVIADQQRLRRVKAHVRAAGVTGKTVLFQRGGGG